MTLVYVNGEEREVAVPNLAAVVAEVSQTQRGIAVAVNGEVVPRSSWAELQLSAGDRVEVLAAAAGG